MIVFDEDSSQYSRSHVNSNDPLLLLKPIKGGSEAVVKLHTESVCLLSSIAPPYNNALLSQSNKKKKIFRAEIGNREL